MGGELQLNHIPLNPGEIRVNFVPLCIAGAAENNVIEVVDGAGRRRCPVGGGVGYHVRAHRQVQLPPCKDLPQAVQIQRRGQVYRDVVREEINVKYIRHRHAHDLPPNQRGLSLFGPGELVDGEVDLKAQVSDGTHDPLMGEGEGIEGAGEEGHLAAVFKLEGTALNAVADNETVDVAEGCGGVEEGQLVRLLLVNKEEEFLGRQGENTSFIVQGEDGGGKDFFTHHP